MKKLFILSVLCLPLFFSCKAGSTDSATVSGADSAKVATITASLASSQTTSSSIEELVNVDTGTPPSGPSGMMGTATMNCANGGTRTRTAAQTDTTQDPMTCANTPGCQLSMTFSIEHKDCKEVMTQCTGTPEYTINGTVVITGSVTFGSSTSGTTATVQRTVKGTLDFSSSLINAGTKVSCVIDTVLTATGNAQAPGPSSVTFTGTICGKTYDDIKSFMQDDTKVCVASAE